MVIYHKENNQAIWEKEKLKFLFYMKLKIIFGTLRYTKKIPIEILH